MRTPLFAMAFVACAPTRYVPPAPIPPIPRKPVETWDCHFADGTPGLRVTGAALPLSLSVWVDGEPVTCLRNADSMACQTSGVVVAAECRILPMTDEVTP